MHIRLKQPPQNIKKKLRNDEKLKTNIKNYLKQYNDKKD